MSAGVASPAAGARRNRPPSVQGRPTADPSIGANGLAAGPILIAGTDEQKLADRQEAVGGPFADGVREAREGVDEDFQLYISLGQAF